MSFQKVIHFDIIFLAKDQRDNSEKLMILIINTAYYVRSMNLISILNLGPFKEDIKKYNSVRYFAHYSDEAFRI